ncbi:MAG: DUF2634 domain-containing protein [Clostridium sp.]
MFPNYEPQIKNIYKEIKATNGKSFLFDFELGDFDIKDGKLTEVEGIEALKIWINKILKTEKFKFKIYETREINPYGTTLLELINSVHPQFFIQAEIQREITEALMKNNNILSVSNFIFTREKRTLIVNFEIETTYKIINEKVIF